MVLLVETPLFKVAGLLVYFTGQTQVTRSNVHHIDNTQQGRMYALIYPQACSNTIEIEFNRTRILQTLKMLAFKGACPDKSCWLKGVTGVLFVKLWSKRTFRVTRRMQFEFNPVAFCVYAYTGLIKNGVRPHRGMLSGFFALASLADPDDFARGVFEGVKLSNRSVGIKVSGSSNVRIENCGFSGLGTAIESNGSSVAINGMVVTDSNIGIHDLSEGIEMSNIKVGNIKAKRVGIVARLPAENVDFEAGDIEMEDVDVGIDVYLTPRQMLEVGLPANTPQEYIKEVKDLVGLSDSSEQVWNSIEKTNLFRWLSTAAIATTLSAPVATVLSNLISML